MTEQELFDDTYDSTSTGMRTAERSQTSDADMVGSLPVSGVPLQTKHGSDSSSYDTSNPLKDDARAMASAATQQLSVRSLSQTVATSAAGSIHKLSALRLQQPQSPVRRKSTDSSVLSVAVPQRYLHLGSVSPHRLPGSPRVRALQAEAVGRPRSVSDPSPHVAGRAYVCRDDCTVI